MIFWAIYIPLSFFMAMCIMRIVGNKSKAYITLSTGSSPRNLNGQKCSWEEDNCFPELTGSTHPPSKWDKFEVVCAVIWWMFWWPFVLGAYSAYKITQFIITGALFELVKFCFCKTPKVSVEVKRDKEGG